MKALYTLIAITLLTGCSHLKSMQKSSADLPISSTINAVPAGKAKADKPKILIPVRVDSLPPLLTENTGTPLANAVKSPLPLTTDFLNSTITPLTTPKVESELIVEPVQLLPTKSLKVGSRGEVVLALEKRLSELDYDAGMLDGVYDKQTRQAVLAFQKYAELKRTGTVTLETQEALLKAAPPAGLHPELGLPRIEIDLTRQVLLYFDDKGLNSVIAVSSGSGRKYCERSKKSGRRVCGVANTPRGEFRIQSRIPGWRESDLGKLYNPLYFNGGFAIHGAPSVPEYNASHGCVRISVATSIWFYKEVKNGTPVIVFD